MRVLKWLGGVLVLLSLAVGGVFAGARFHDGPLGPIPGGALASGPLVTEAVSDWSFAAGIPEIELQLADESSSRTVWVVVDQGRAFIPCSLEFPPGKRWHLRADQDGRALVRIAGKRYPVTLDRVQDPTLTTLLGEAIGAKYPGAADLAGGGIWFFRLDPRSPDS